MAILNIDHDNNSNNKGNNLQSEIIKALLKLLYVFFVMSHACIFRVNLHSVVT